MPRSKDQSKKMRDDRKTQIFSAALELFAARGLSATRISDIAAKAGFSQGLMYHYYRSKEQIYSELIEFAFERMISACRILEGLPLPPEEKIRKAIAELLRNLKESDDSARYYLLVAQASLSEAIPETLKSLIQKKINIPHKILAHIFREGQKRGTVRKKKADELAMVFWTTMKGLALHKAVHGHNMKFPNPDIFTKLFLVEAS